MKLTFAGHRCCDHSPSSGYDQVCGLFPAAGWLSGPELAAGRLVWVRRPSTGGPIGGPEQVFHVFYGDCSGHELPAVLRGRFPLSTIVSTVHQPVSRLVRDPAGLASLRPVDGIVTVSGTQARELADLGVSVPIQVVPHGVWTRVFRPVGSHRCSSEVLVVGNYLRDWPGTGQILHVLAAAGVGSVVLGAAGAKELGSHPLVQVIPKVSEAELAGLYHRSAALLLPVLDATASNALLEAMSAGCPVICPRLPSLVEEYIGDDVDAYPPGRNDIAAAKALRYVSDPARRADRARALIRRAERFDWARLLPQMAEVYHRHQGQGSRSTGT